MYNEKRQMMNFIANKNVITKFETDTSFIFSKTIEIFAITILYIFLNDRKENELRRRICNRALSKEACQNGTFEVENVKLKHAY